MAKLHTLTVQDILWINLQVTKKVQHFSYAKLEEATYYQYAYGDSNEVLSQAGRFLAGFLKMHPLDAGNEATAFVATLAFLKINGLVVEGSKISRDWFFGAASSVETAREALAAVVEHDDDHHHHDVRSSARTAIQGVLQNHASLVEGLLAMPATV